MCWGAAAAFCALPALGMKPKPPAKPPVKAVTRALARTERQRVEQLEQVRQALVRLHQDEVRLQALESSLSAQPAASNETAATKATSPAAPVRAAAQPRRGASPGPRTSLSDSGISTLKKEVEHPDALRYKGITITPGGFLEAATVWRSAATGGDINTPFTGIPLDYSEGGNISEFHASARQSRLVLKAEGKLQNVVMTGYYEMDWLGTGITSNNNQSNSYVARVRQLFARAAFHSGWSISAGQMWSLATETTHGLDNLSEILPGTIDPQYTAGFVWARQYGFRITKDINHQVWLGVSLENPQTLVGGTVPSNNETLGEPGNGGGLFNPAANYSFNVAPDMIAKLAVEPGWGHWELFGIGRFFRNRIYPNAASKSSAGAYNSTVMGGGIGGGFRVPLATRKISFGLKGLWGDGVGRYGDSAIADVTLRPDGTIAPLHAFSALSTLEFFPTKRWYIYLNYGGDYVDRNIQGADGYGLLTANMSGCNTEALPGGPYAATGTGPCAGNTRDVQEFSSGFWYNFYQGSKGIFRYGIQYSHFVRNLWSGAGGPLNPGGGAMGADNGVWTSVRYILP